MISSTFFEILSPLPLNTEADARRLLGLWAEMAPHLLPDRAGTFEPLRKPFSITEMASIIAEWEFQILFKRVAKPKLESSVFVQYGPHRQHSTWKISIDDSGVANLLELLSLVERAATDFSTDFGFIHRPIESDIAIGLASSSISYLSTAKRKIGLFVTTHHLEKYIPDIYWVTVFGKPYVNLFSRERLLSAPAYRVRELPNGSMLVQLTEYPPGLGEPPNSYETQKSLVKDHLNPKAFFSLEKGLEYEYSVPTFRWDLLH